jgi:hypothetical protein
MELNSDRAEGFHSWSSNGRWIAFSSKRQDTQFTQLYFSHIDSSGNTTKAFVLPQEDPLFYETCLEIYNVPELTKDPVRVSPQALTKAAYAEQDAMTAKLDPSIVQYMNIMKATSAQSAQIQQKPGKTDQRRGR